MKEFYKLAVANVAHYGDTDIFPFPVENSLFFDMPQRVLDLLLAADTNFESSLDQHPPLNLNSLAPAGYAGFRWATQLDPVWNCYLLGLVLSYADRIEAARIPVQDGCIFSYAIRLLGLRHSDEAEGLLTRMFENSHSPFVRKEIIMSMARWGAMHWLSDKKRFFQVMSSWEKRAFLIASYVLGDAGKHWRDHVKDTFDPFTSLLHEWCGSRANQIRAGQIPL